MAAVVLTAQAVQGVHSARLTGTFTTAGDVATIGLAGDSGAGVQLQAGFGGTAGAAVDTDANLGQLVQVIKNFLSDPSIGATGSADFQVVKSTGPFRITITLRGTPTAPVSMEFYTTYPFQPTR